MTKHEHVTRCRHVVQALATRIKPWQARIIDMATTFIWAVATWWEGRIYLMSAFYTTKAAAQAEYFVLREMDQRVLAGKAFLYMHAVDYLGMDVRGEVVLSV